MYISDLDPERLTNKQMENLLFSGLDDDKKSGDCIFVVGSSKAVQYRLPMAIKLYNEGRANKILFSGGVKWGGNELSEALELKDKAIASGVPEKDVLVENNSLHTLENVLASLLILDREFHLYKIKRLLVVTNSYHMKRLQLTLKTYMPDWIDFTLCPTEHNHTRKDNWFLHEQGRSRVADESSKIIHYVRNGALRDEYINCL